MDRQQLINEAKKKFERETLVAAAKDKFARQSVAPENSDEAGIFSKIGGSILDGVSYVGEKVDRVTGAPARSAIGKLQDDFTDLPGALGAAASQFGAPANLAPTGKRLAQKAGLGETALSDVAPSLFSESGDEFFKFKRGSFLDPTASGVAGLGLDIVADPTNVIPIGFVAKQVGRGAKAVSAPAKAGLNMAGDVARGAAGAAVKAADVVTGTKVATSTVDAAANAARAVKDTAKDAASAIFKIGTPKRVENYGALVKTADALGISPEQLSAAAEFGKNATVSRFERSIAEGPLGGQLLGNFEEVASKIASGVDDKVAAFGGGRVYDSLSAGEMLKTGFSKAEKAVLDGANITYKNAADLSPGLMLTKESSASLQSALSGLEKRAKGYVARGATKEQVSMGRDLLGLSTRMKNNGSNYRQLSQQIGFIGDAMSDPNLNRVQAKELRKVYRELSTSLIDTVKALRPDMGKQLIDNNKVMSEFFNSRDILGQAIQAAKSNPESLFKTMAGNSAQIDELKKILPKADFDSFRASYLDSLIKRNADGFVLYDSSIKQMKSNSGRLSKMFSPDEIDEIGGILELGNSQGIPVLSTSGTGGSNIFKDIKEGISNSVVNQSVVNKMKERGRGISIPDESIGASMGAAINAPVSRPMGLTEATISMPGMPQLPGRGKIEGRLKAAQSIAPSTYEPQEQESAFVERAASMETARLPSPGAKLLKLSEYDTEETVPVPPGVDFLGGIKNSQLTNIEKAKILRRFSADGTASKDVISYVIKGGK